MIINGHSLAKKFNATLPHIAFAPTSLAELFAAQVEVVDINAGTGFDSWPLYRVRIKVRGDGLNKLFEQSFL